MTVVLTATTGLGLFDRLGHSAKTNNDIDTNFVDAQRTRNETLLHQHTASTQNEEEAALVGMIRTIQASGQMSMQAQRDYSINRTIDMVDDDEQLASKTLVNALHVLDRQMRDASEGLVHNTATFSNAAQAGNTGNGNAVVSLVDFRGNPLKFVRGEIIKLECIKDAQPDGGSKLGGEEFTITGEKVLPFNDEAWPGGSGAASSMKSSAGSIEASKALGENLVVNGGFESTSASNTFDQWESVVGGFGSRILEDSDAFVGSKALKFNGATGVLTDLRQKTAKGADGTPVTLDPRTHYSMGFYIKHDGTSATTGSLDVKITSSTGGAMQVTPAQGSVIDAKITVDVTSTTSVTASYQFKSVDFVTPAQLPTDPEIHIALTTAMPASRNILIDEVVIQKLTPAYTGGPYLGLHRGAAAWVRDDVVNVTITNNNTATGTGRLIRALDRSMGVMETGETIASTTATSVIPDTLLA